MHNTKGNRNKTGFYASGQHFFLIIFIPDSVTLEKEINRHNGHISFDTTRSGSSRQEVTGSASDCMTNEMHSRSRSSKWQADIPNKFFLCPKILKLEN